MRLVFISGSPGAAPALCAVRTSEAGWGRLQQLELALALEPQMELALALELELALAGAMESDLWS